MEPDLIARPRATWKRYLAPAGSRALLGSALLAALLMAANWFSDPPSADAGYGHNWPGDLASTLAKLACELLVLFAILRPWSYRHSWRRALLAFVGLAPYALLSFAVTMHAGGIVNTHVFWLMGVWLVLPPVVIHGLEGRFRARRAPREAC